MDMYDYAVDEITYGLRQSYSGKLCLQNRPFTGDAGINDK